MKVPQKRLSTLVSEGKIITDPNCNRGFNNLYNNINITTTEDLLEETWFASDKTWNENLNQNNIRESESLIDAMSEELRYF